MHRFSTLILATFTLLFTLAAETQTVNTTVTVGSSPRAVAINPATNKIYVANYASNSVTVIDGATNATTTVAAGYIPSAVAVNPGSNKIYVVNEYGSNVTVIDGAAGTKS